MSLCSEQCYTYLVIYNYFCRCRYNYSIKTLLYTQPFRAHSLEDTPTNSVSCPPSRKSCIRHWDVYSEYVLTHAQMMECRPTGRGHRRNAVSGLRGSLEPTIDRKRQLYRKFADYYSRSFGFARIKRTFRFSSQIHPIDTNRVHRFPPTTPNAPTISLVLYTRVVINQQDKYPGLATRLSLNDVCLLHIPPQPDICTSYYPPFLSAVHTDV